MRARTVRQHAVDQLERLVSRDVGGRGSGALLHPGDLWQSALALAQPATRSVLITTGFPCCTTHTPPTETDGIGGSIAIARSLEAIGKRVSFVVDAANYAVLDASVRCGKAERYLAASDVLLYPATTSESEGEGVGGAADLLTAREKETCAEFMRAHGSWDHLVAIERAGRAADGGFYTMRAIDMGDLVAPIDNLFLAAATSGVESTGIGDGGNELGMGKVARATLGEQIQHGATIGSVTATTHLIAAGVSDWGGYALAAAIVLAAEVHELEAEAEAEAEVPGVEVGVGVSVIDAEARRAAALSTVAGQRLVLRAAVDSGARDGCTGELSMSVDGFAFDAEHAAMIESIAALVLRVETKTTPKATG